MLEMKSHDDEFEMLLGEIPRATSSSPLNHHHHSVNLVDRGYGHAPPRRVSSHGGVHTHAMYDDELLKHKYACPSSSSPVSGLSLQSDGSSSSLFSGGGGGGLSLSDIGSPSPPQLGIPGNGFWLDFKKDNSIDEASFLDGFNLSRNLSKMYISDEQEYGAPFLPNDSTQSRSRSPNGAALLNLKNYGPQDNYRSYFNHLSIPREAMNPVSPMVEMQHDQRIANLLGSLRHSPNRPERVFPRPDFSNLAMRPQFYRSSNNFPMGNTPVNLVQSREAFFMPNLVQLAHLSPRANEENHLPSMPNGREDGSLIIQGGEGINHGLNRGHVRSRGHNSSSSSNSNNNNSTKNSLSQEKMFFSLSLPSKCSSLVEFQGYIYPIAKDQHGCRFLQRMFDEGTSRDVQIVFNEIIDHVVELMMNPFGNYLMQKLLEVCSEEHKMHILLRVTEEPGELVRISLNTHGTRVVQKLIETLKTRQQKALVISALEPGFLALIKDLNGNHVVQRCLQCFTTEDSKFIFIAAAKYCVEIATHQHGCCVLQRCITYATGDLRENLVEEIAANGLLLAQDAYGNYVIQFILELKLPSATSKLTCQFEGHYVNLSRQKFSSHVVEKCLAVCNDEIRSKIIHELLSATYFEQLLQDPHANYVVQTALRVSQGRLTRLHNSLVEAVESYKAISRNSPYSKRIFSHKLLKR